MTREEAIMWIKDIKENYIHGGDEGYDKKRKCALDMAISALRAQQETEKNEPLTLDELREMRGEPVYIVLLDEDKSWWIVIRGVTDSKLTTDYGGWFALKEYGKTWLAYRRKPEDGMT